MQEIVESGGEDAPHDSRRDAGATHYTALLHQRLAGRQDRHFVELGGETALVRVSFGGGEPFAQVRNLDFAGTAPANLRPAAGCGHVGLLKCDFAIVSTAGTAG